MEELNCSTEYQLFVDILSELVLQDIQSRRFSRLEAINAVTKLLDQENEGYLDGLLTAELLGTDNFRLVA